MSIEKDLSRIATALERIAERYANPTMTVTSGACPPIATPGVQVMEPLNIPVPPVTPSPVSPIEPEAVPATPVEVRAVAAKIATAIDPTKVPAFTAWVRDTLLPKYGVKKLIDIPPASVEAAAKEIFNYGKKAGVNV